MLVTKYLDLMKNHKNGLPTVAVVSHKLLGSGHQEVATEIQGWDVGKALDAVAALGGPGSYRLVSLTNKDAE